MALFICGIWYRRRWCDLSNAHLCLLSLLPVPAHMRPTLRRAQAQIDFFQRAISFLQRETDETLLQYVHAYHAFLLGRARDKTLQPSFAVEVVWRAHLLSPIDYAEVSAFRFVMLLTSNSSD